MYVATVYSELSQLYSIGKIILTDKLTSFSLKNPLQNYISTALVLSSDICDRAVLLISMTLATKHIEVSLC